jgi:hypothetical protein
MPSTVGSEEHVAARDRSGVREQGREPLRIALLRGALLGLAGGITHALTARRGSVTASGLMRAVVLGATYSVAERVLYLPPLVAVAGALEKAAAPIRAARPPSRPMHRDGEAIRTRSQLSQVSPSVPPTANRHRAFRQLNAGAVALSFSVVADSALEHYRGGFYNPAMYIAPAVSGITLATSLSAASGTPRNTRLRNTVFGAAALTGLIGTGFHTYNISKRIGGWRWDNLFYGAPLAAPTGITTAGLFGLAASRALVDARRARPPMLLGFHAGPLIAGGAALGLLGTAAEAGLLHFRGAFQNPFMFLPVTIPPLAALSLGAVMLEPTGGRKSIASGMLWSTVALGFIGMGFHAYGVHRNMGGWHNWTQMIQQGPPVPAPPSFTGMALAGLAALEMMEGDTRA